ncbi:MAG: hypothetical protein ACTH5B_03230 [Marinomonas sp.]|uniref:hypothetical protein n=1 Tax=Marinomonas sp. TaxID=1904862 RepID=UPI003F9E1B4A
MFLIITLLVSNNHTTGVADRMQISLFCRLFVSAPIDFSIRFILLVYSLGLFIVGFEALKMSAIESQKDRGEE